MSEFHDYLNNNPHAWSTVGNQRTGWHFCFAGFNSSPSNQLRVYCLGYSEALRSSTFSESNRPSTEEFPPSTTRNVINDVVDASTLWVIVDDPAIVNVDIHLAVLCTSKGYLYVQGNERVSLENNRKLFGFGPENIENRLLDNYLATGRRVFKTKTSRGRLTRVLGENGDLEQVEFKSVASHQHCLAALDSYGSIWFSGDPCRSGFTVEGQFPNDAGGLLSFFRKADFESYEDASGTVTPAQPLAFKKIRAGGTTMLALGDDDYLYVWGKFNLGKELTSTRPHRVDGFVDSVELVAGGSAYTTTPSVTASTPQHPDGTTAVFQITRTGDQITGISISNPGWGYTSAPTITFSGGGGSGASATAALFSDTWLDCDATAGKACGAISSAGRFYLTSGFYLYSGSSWFSPSSETGFTAISLAGSHGCLSRSDNFFSIWGLSNFVKPELGNNIAVPLTTVEELGNTVVSAKAFFQGYAVLTDNGRVFSAGSDLYVGRGFGGSTQHVSLNSGTIDGVSRARFSAIFGTSMTLILNRIESRDEFGNLLDPLPPGLPS